MSEQRIMNTASPKVDELARRLARLTGEDVETALERAVEERLSRIEGDATERNRRAAMRAFFDRVSKMPVVDARPVDEVIGCGLDGLLH
jgi:antitoxin VapB